MRGAPSLSPSSRKARVRGLGFSTVYVTPTQSPPLRGRGKEVGLLWHEKGGRRGSVLLPSGGEGTAFLVTFIEEAKRG